MAIWHRRYTRKLSPIERASLVLNEFCNYNCDIVVEGHGALSVDTLRSAVERAAQANPGSRVRLRGVLGFSRWVDSGIAPEVREVQAPMWDGRSERGAGFRQFLSILDEGRIAIAALAIGAIQACLDHGVRYANERQAFGRPIGANQAIAFKCADVAVMCENARLLTYKAAWLRDTGKPFTTEAAMAKLYASEVAHRATDGAVQVWGGLGYCKPTVVERLYRDQRILEIYEGTSEIQRLVLARAVRKEAEEAVAASTHPMKG